MNHNEPVIEISRSLGGLKVKAIMPTWNKSNEEGKIIIEIPLLGEVVTCAENEDDAETAVREAFHCFCIISERHGMGIENELEFIGWKKSEESDSNRTIMNVITEQPIMERIMDTGDSRLLDFAL